MEKVKKLNNFHGYDVEKVKVIDDITKEITDEYFVTYDYKKRKLGTAKTVKEIHELIKQNEREHGFIVEYNDPNLVDIAKPYGLSILADDKDDAIELAKIVLDKRKTYSGAKQEYVIVGVHVDWGRYFMK